MARFWNKSCYIMPFLVTSHKNLASLFFLIGMLSSPMIFKAIGQPQVISMILLASCGSSDTDFLVHLASSSFPSSRVNPYKVITLKLNVYLHDTAIYKDLAKSTYKC